MAYCALIPARSGSKGIKDKNIKKLHGKPLMAYSIDAARQVGDIGAVYVSTDSPKYAEIAIENGSECPFLRPADLANDTASTNQVIQHFMNNIGKKFDHIILLQPTSPLRNVDDIKNAIALYESQGADVLYSLCPQDKHPNLFRYIDDNHNITPFMENTTSRRQDNPPLYRLNGAIYIFSWQYFAEHGHFNAPKAVGYVMPNHRSVDIDTNDDWEYCEFLMNKG